MAAPIAIAYRNEAPLPAAVEADARRYLRSSRSDNTKRAYRASVAVFVRWCDRYGRNALPAGASTVVAFLADQAAEGLSSSTLSLRVAAIGYAHRTAGEPNPCNVPAVADALRGVKREHANERRGRGRAAALTVERLAACLATLDRETLRGKRDAALLALGFAIGARRSELVALDLADIADDGDGLHLTIHRSKTDQTGEGADLYVPIANNAQLCAVRAVREWLQAAAIIGAAGALFRRVSGLAGVGERLSDRSVDLVVRRCAKRAGLDAEGRYSAHSLRAGLVTTLAERGRTEVEIMRQSRHRSSTMVRTYTRPIDAKRGCPLAGAF